MTQYISTGLWPGDTINANMLYRRCADSGAFIEYINYFNSKNTYRIGFFFDILNHYEKKFPQLIGWLVRKGYAKKEKKEKSPFKIGDVITCWDKEDGMTEYYLIASVGVNKIALVSLWNGLRWTDPIDVESNDNIPYSVIENLINDDEGFCEWYLDKRQTCRTIMLKERE